MNHSYKNHNLKQIWISSDGKKSGYSFYTLGGIFGIAILDMMLILGGVFLSFHYQFPRKIFAAVLCLSVTFLSVCLALWVGRHVQREATVFF